MANDIVLNLFKDISQLVDSAKIRVAHYANSSLVLLYWQIGQRIYREILKEERAEYGEGIIKQLASQLNISYGRGFNARALFRMVRFAKYFSEEKIVVTLSPLLSWSHFVELIALDDVLKRQFYADMCRLEHWSVRDLRKKIDGMLYERTAISQQPRTVIQEDLKRLQQDNELTQELVFRDPYILDFLQLPTTFSESKLEDAILDELCKFLQELGTDFCFISRQKRITIDSEDFYIDLLMYHRGLKRLVAIELKLGKFTASHKGQMELYLRWLDKYERRVGEEQPLGLILCSEKQHEHVELLELGKSGIHVAQYLTELPPRKILEERLHKAIEIAREMYERASLTKDK
ncbi:cytoplasmic protein [Gammaproteobacteria bacterium SCGC AG-212-F23]|nr:cytoplasmic protein [Gammaproteobacteria bacterium SCGC AG-212-F23]